MKFLKIYWWIFLIGFLIRVFIAGSAYHPDARNTLNLSSAVMIREGQWNPYEFVNGVKENLYKIEVADDLPLNYFIHLPLDYILSPLVDKEIEEQFFIDIRPLLGSFDLSKHLIIIKLPVIVFDLLLAFCLTLFFSNQESKKKALLIWLFNPLTIWTTAAIGQIDVIPAFFILLSVLYLKSNKLYHGAFFLGLGGAIKSAPFLIAPFLIFSAKGWIERGKLLILLIAPLVLSVLPYIQTVEFRQNALFAPQLEKIFFAKIALSGGEALYLTVGILFILYFLFFNSKKGYEIYMNFILAGLLLTLSLTHFHIQWFIWIMPLFVIVAIRGLRESQKLALFLLYTCVGIMVFLFDASLSVRLFAPIFPSANTLIGLGETLDSSQLTFIRSIIASIFAAAAVFFSTSLILNQDKK